MDQSKLIAIIQDNLDRSSFCSDMDWEFNSGGNGINASEAFFTLRGLAEEINSEAGEEILSMEYDEEKMKNFYRDAGYPVDDEDEEF